MKVKIIIYSLFFILTGCSYGDSKPPDNALLGDKVQVYYVDDLVNSTQPEEWMKNLDREELFRKVFDQILDKGKIVYSPQHTYFDTTKFATSKILEYLNWKNDERDFSELQEILFYESWYVPSNLKSFTKKIEFWCPVQVWHPDNDMKKTYKRKLFNVKPTANKTGEEVADGIFTEFDLSHASNFPIWTGLDDRKFINFVFDKVQTKDITAYDPIYVVDKSLKPFSVAELEKYMGQPLNSKTLRNDVTSLIFEENWYFEPKSMNIYKEVKSLGFVRKYWENGDYKSKILFFIKFK